MSIVVLAYRNGPTIGAAVASLLAQDAPEPFEVIVVASGEEGDADAVRERFPHVTVVQAATRLLPGGARNRGVEAARGRVVAFLAGDCEAEPGWVAARLAAHRAGHPVVASAVTNGRRRRPAAWGFYYAQFPSRLPGRPAGPVSFPNGGAHGVSFDRSVLRAVGGFSEDLPVGEDTEMIRRVSALGIAVWYEPTVRTSNRGPGGLVDLWREQLRRGAARVLPARLLGLSSDGGMPARTLRRTRFTFGELWRFADRWRVALVAPWILAAILGSEVGWRREHRREQAPRGRSIQLRWERWAAAAASLAACITLL